MAALVALAVVATGACGDTEEPEDEAFCTLVGCFPAVDLDASALGDVTGGEICLDEECNPLVATNGRMQTGPEDAGGPREISLTGVLVLADGTERPLTPTTFDLEEVFPNGEGCDPTCWGADLEVAADGTVTQR
jgi:hypothetical protein